MLTYSFKLNNANRTGEIKLNDSYVSSDLSYISGTVSSNCSLSESDTLWVDTSYFPTPRSVSVSSVKTVKRNGYVRYLNPLRIEYAEYIDDGIPSGLTYYKDDPEMYSGTPNITRTVRYVEWNGNTYYQDMSQESVPTFEIEGKTYVLTVNSKNVPFWDKAYVEDDTVEISGITYNVLYGDKPEYTTFTDSTGNAFVPDSNIWDISNVTTKYEYVQKVAIGADNTHIIKTSDVTWFGYQPYIRYKGQRYDFDYYDIVRSQTSGVQIINSSTGYAPDDSGATITKTFGVKVDDLFFDAMCDYSYMASGTPSEYERVFNQMDFYTKALGDYQVGDLFVEISGVTCYISYEPVFDGRGDKICIETGYENESILVDDILTITGAESQSIIPVEEDSRNKKYVMINSSRYYATEGLCNYIKIGDKEYQLTFEDDRGISYFGRHLTITLETGETLRLIVSETEDGFPTLVKKAMLNSDGDWVESMSVVDDGSGGTVYKAVSGYTVYKRDGVKINGENYPIVMSKGTSINNVVEYESIVYDHVLSYKFQVDEAIGSNRIICHPYINEELFHFKDVTSVKRSIAQYVVNNACIVTKVPNTFGTLELTMENWLSDAITTIGPTSVWGLSNIWNNIVIYKYANYYTLPLHLERSVNNDMMRDDLITSTYYNEMEEEYVNKIVDMDKDMYTPYGKDSSGNYIPIEKMQFNLHFRTRDMDNWNIIQDESTYTTSGKDGTYECELSANKDYCNWFCTDYWPYNQGTKGSYTYSSQKDIMQMSDLLGFLYFTTDDVKRKAKKLAKSFLRLSFYDSIDPQKQNMLGTSTLFFDCDRYFETAYNGADNAYTDKLHYIYYDVAKSYNPKRTNEGKWYVTPDDALPVGVLRDAFLYNIEIQEKSGKSPVVPCGKDFTNRLDSRIEVTDRYTTTSSSEGFYAYILKHYANKTAKQTIYMKTEFFHAGVGVKIPMVLATDSKMDAISEWTDKELTDFKKGYDLKEATKRLYIPIEISYNKEDRQFSYMISDTHGFRSATQEDNTYIFNLFELKVRT